MSSTEIFYPACKVLNDPGSAPVEQVTLVAPDKVIIRAVIIWAVICHYYLYFSEENPINTQVWVQKQHQITVTVFQTLAIS